MHGLDVQLPFWDQYSPYVITTFSAIFAYIGLALMFSPEESVFYARDPEALKLLWELSVFRDTFIPAMACAFLFSSVIGFVSVFSPVIARSRICIGIGAVCGLLILSNVSRDQGDGVVAFVKANLLPAVFGAVATGFGTLGVRAHWIQRREERAAELARQQAAMEEELQIPAE